MNVRALKHDDLPKLERINKEFYPSDAFPSFGNNFISRVAITDDRNRIICAGGLEHIAEAVAITDKEFPARTRYKALEILLDYLEQACRNNNHSIMHVFVSSDTDNSWIRALQGVDFRELRQRVLFKEVRNG